MNVDVIILIILIVGVVMVGLYFLNRWASTKMVTQQTAIERHKMPATIYVIDKKRDKITNVNMPKAAVEQVPSYVKMMKHNFVMAKIGPQIMTLMCDKQIYNAIPVKKNVKIELAGIYIVSMKGMKTKKEIKDAKKEEKHQLVLAKRLEKEEQGKK